MTKLTLITAGSPIIDCDLPIPADLSGTWAERFVEMVDAVSQQAGAIPSDVIMIGETVRLMRRGHAADQASSMALAMGDLKTFREMATVAAQANNSIRSNMRELKITPSDRSSKIGKQIQGQRVIEGGGGDGWDGLL